MRWLHFILSHSVFSSLCAVALCYQTIILLHIPVQGLLLVFVFFSSLCSYNFYWLISKFAFSKKLSLRSFVKINLSYIILFLLAGAGMIYCLYFLPFIYPLVAIAVALTLLYSLPLWPLKIAVYLRRAGVFKTILLAFTWTFVTVVIPAQPVLQAQTKAVIILITARFFFMLMLCIIFDKRDIAVDKMHGLQSLATDVSKKKLSAIMLLAFIIYLGVGFYMRYQFSYTLQLFAFLITGLAVGWVYRLSLKKQGYLFYYFVVDGLMLFSAGATFIATLL